MGRKLVQLGYITTDVDRALNYWVETTGAGPFYFADYEPERQTYRGEPTHITFRNAYGYLGDMQIELIEQLSGGASAYSEALAGAAAIPVGGLFHHVMLLHEDYDAVVADFVREGAQACYDAFVPGVGRFCYLDARAQAGSYVELVEDTVVFEAASECMRVAHLEWDGTRPRRSIEEVVG